MITILFQAALWIWFLGCTVTYRIGKALLVEGMGVKSAEFAVLCLYSAGLAAFHCLQPAGKWILAGILLLWFAVQFMCHWYFTLFGASERKLKGYNESFRGPDLSHERSTADPGHVPYRSAYPDPGEYRLLLPVIRPAGRQNKMPGPLPAQNRLDRTDTL